MSHRWFIGLSSGSGLSGVDAALVRADGLGLGMALHLERFLHQPYPGELRDMLRGAASGEATAAPTVALLHRVLGESFAGAILQLADDARFDLRRAMCVGCSGHTLWHETDCRYPTSLNVGMAGAIAEKTGLTTLTDPRSQDVVSGGQGGPLTALADWLLFHDPVEPRLLIHLGGVATALGLPAACHAKQIIGFHAAPGCLLLDGFMQRLTGGKEPFDAFGKHAVQGRCIEPLLERWLAHPLLQRKPPRTIAQRDFGQEFIAQAVQTAKQLDRSLHDLLCTATHFVARATIESLHRWVPWAPGRVLVSGGGVRNGFLWRLLEQHLTPTPLEKIDACGVPCEARKAVAFAALAALTMDAVPGNLPAVTGANGSRLLGSFTPGTPANWSHCLAWMARQAAVPRLAAA